MTPKPANFPGTPPRHEAARSPCAASQARPEEHPRIARSPSAHLLAPPSSHLVDRRRSGWQRSWSKAGRAPRQEIARTHWRRGDGQSHVSSRTSTACALSSRSQPPPQLPSLKQHRAGLGGRSGFRSTDFALERGLQAWGSTPAASPGAGRSSGAVGDQISAMPGEHPQPAPRSARTASARSSKRNRRCPRRRWRHPLPLLQSGSSSSTSTSPTPARKTPCHTI